MKKILLIDDSPLILKTLELKISVLCPEVEILLAASFKEASDIIRKSTAEISIAVVDLNLPDCKEGQAVSLTSSRHIPTIVLTGNHSSELKELLHKKDVLDYVMKDTPNSINYVASSIKRHLRNSNTTALVVDDSKLYRTVLVQDLQKLRINTLEASSAQEALYIIETTDQTISLVLTDYDMPEMNGIELTSFLREQFEKDTLSIIALSATNDRHILPEFIKTGADDFLSKPHNFAELNVRVNSNLDTLELFQKTKDLASKDFLTGSYNRRYFFEVSEAIIAKNVRKEQSIALATLDIDNFKMVNDTYGHDVGDVAIKEIVTILNMTLRKSDLVARFGGEEYCILLEDITLENTYKVFEEIRVNFEKNSIFVGEIELAYTVSLGVFYGKSDNITEMLKVSDEALYKAKDNGRNQVIIHQK